jgi:hypothetical protein
MTSRRRVGRNRVVDIPSIKIQPRCAPTAAQEGSASNRPSPRGIAMTSRLLGRTNQQTSHHPSTKKGEPKLTLVRFDLADQISVFKPVLA